MESLFALESLLLSVASLATPHNNSLVTKKSSICSSHLRIILRTLECKGRTLFKSFYIHEHISTYKKENCLKEKKIEDKNTSLYYNNPCLPKESLNKIKTWRNRARIFLHNLFSFVFAPRTKIVIIIIIINIDQLHYSIMALYRLSKLQHTLAMARLASQFHTIHTISYNFTHKSCWSRALQMC